MAEEEKNPEGTQEAEGGSGSKKMIIIIAVVVILAIGISVGATLFLLGGDESTEETEEAVAEEQESDAQYIDLTPAFLVTFSANGRQRYMQAHVSISTKFPSNTAALEHHMPLIRSKISGLFSTQEFTSLQTDEGKKALLESTKASINGVLEAEGEQPIDRVYFTNFVLQ